MIIKTLPVAEWVDTVITGLTTDPLRLTNSFAQSYGPGHHNFREQFIFEPGLDPSVTPAQKAELDAANIRLLHVLHNRIDLGSPERQPTSSPSSAWTALPSRFPGDTAGRPPEAGRDSWCSSPRAKTTRENPTRFPIRSGRSTAAGRSRTGHHLDLDRGQPGQWELTCADPLVPGVTGTATVLVAGVALDGNGTLQVVGTGGNDKVWIGQTGQNSLRVYADFLTGTSHTRQFRLARVKRIEVHGGAGHDTLQANGVGQPLWIDGGPGKRYRARRPRRRRAPRRPGERRHLGRRGSGYPARGRWKRHALGRSRPQPPDRRRRARPALRRPAGGHPDRRQNHVLRSAAQGAASTARPCRPSSTSGPPPAATPPAAPTSATGAAAPRGQRQLLPPTGKHRPGRRPARQPLRPPPPTLAPARLNPRSTPGETRKRVRSSRLIESVRRRAAGPQPMRCCRTGQESCSNSSKLVDN